MSFYPSSDHLDDTPDDCCFDDPCSDGCEDRSMGFRPGEKKVKGTSYSTSIQPAMHYPGRHRDD